MPDETSRPRQSGTEDLKATASEMRDRASTEGEALKEQARSGMHDAKDGAMQRGEDAKDRAADEVSKTSSALRKAANELDDGSVQHRIFSEAADAVSGVSDALSNRSIEEIFNGLTRFGRRNPAALIGGSVLAGLIVSRFVKASGHAQPDRMRQRRTTLQSDGMPAVADPGTDPAMSTRPTLGVGGKTT